MALPQNAAGIFYSKKSCAIGTGPGETLEVAAFLQGLDTLGADVLAAENHDILGVIAENAGGLILSEDNRGTIHVDLQRVLFGDIQRTAQFDRQDDAAQLINFPNDSGRLQFYHPFLFCAYIKQGVSLAKTLLKKIHTLVRFIILQRLILSTVCVKTMQKKCSKQGESG